MKSVWVCLSLEQENTGYLKTWIRVSELNGISGDKSVSGRVAGRRGGGGGGCYMAGLPQAVSAAGWVSIQALGWTPSFDQSMLSVLWKPSGPFPKVPSSSFSPFDALSVYIRVVTCFLFMSHWKEILPFLYHGWTSTILWYMKKYCLASRRCEIKNQCKSQVSKRK